MVGALPGNRPEGIRGYDVMDAPIKLGPKPNQGPRLELPRAAASRREHRGTRGGAGETETASPVWASPSGGGGKAQPYFPSRVNSNRRGVPPLMYPVVATKPPVSVNSYTILFG